MTTFVKYRDANNKWRWRLVAANNKIIADSSEGYDNEAGCDHAIGLVKQSHASPIRKV